MFHVISIETLNLKTITHYLHFHPAVLQKKSRPLPEKQTGLMNLLFLFYFRTIIFMVSISLPVSILNK
jgi:hypothetical protein